MLNGGTLNPPPFLLFHLRLVERSPGYLLAPDQYGGDGRSQAVHCLVEERRLQADHGPLLVEPGLVDQALHLLDDGLALDPVVGPLPLEQDLQDLALGVDPVRRLQHVYQVPVCLGD